MERIELASQFFQAIEEQDWFKLEQMLDDDFRYYSFMPDPFDKKTWLAFEEAVQQAFPDWSYNIQKMEEKGDKVFVTVKITGTHKNTLVLPWPGFKPLPPTQARIEMPEEHAILKFRDSKISELRVETMLHGSLPGLLEQLGLE